MHETNIRKAIEYYHAVNDKNLINAQKNIAPDVHFISPFANIKGKDAFIQAVAQFMNLFKTLTIQSSFEAGDQVMLVYSLECAEPIGTFRTAALMNFKDGLITRIELFFDARIFEQKKS